MQALAKVVETKPNTSPHFKGLWQQQIAGGRKQSLDPEIGSLHMAFRSFVWRFLIQPIHNRLLSSSRKFRIPFSSGYFTKNQAIFLNKMLKKLNHVKRTKIAGFVSASSLQLRLSFRSKKQGDPRKLSFLNWLENTVSFGTPCLIQQGWESFFSPLCFSSRVSRPCLHFVLTLKRRPNNWHFERKKPIVYL